MCFHPPKVPKHRLLNDKDYSNPLFQQRRRNSPLVRWCLFILTCIFTFIFLAESTRAATPAQIESSAITKDDSPLDSKAGQLFIQSDDGASNPALHLGSKVSFVVSGMVLHTTFSQTFRNPSNDQWVEGIYVFPMPEKAAISHMDMRIGERVIVGEIKEKELAKKQYQKAKAAGKRVALVEQERPNLFTQNVANIGPGEEVTITLKYQDTVAFDAGRFSFRFPMTITPRFMPSAHAWMNGDLLPKPSDDAETRGTQISQKVETELQTATQMVLDNSRPWGWSAPTSLVPDAHRISPPQLDSKTAKKALTHNIQLSIVLDAGLPLKNISSPYHDLVIEKKREQHFIGTRENHIPMDRDFELQWQPVAQSVPSAAAFTEMLTRDQIGGDEQATNLTVEENYALLMLLPPQQTHSTQLARDVIYIIDTSGSMGGTSIRQAKQSLNLALKRLNKGDRFNVIEFNSNHRNLFGTSQDVNQSSRAQALKFVDSLNAGGGTNMAPALDAALSAHHTETHLRQIVFITDGSVGNESQLFELIYQKLGQARLFTVAIGSAPNSFFMRKAAQFGRGTFTHIGDSQEVSDKMSKLFSKLESPVLRNLSIQWPDSANVEVWPKKLPDLYRGEPLLIKAKLGEFGQSKTVTVKGDQGGKPWEQVIKLQKPEIDTVTHTGISKLWAREKISALLDEKTRGADESAIKPKVLQVALQHQLMSPYTSFIAEDKTPARPLEKNLESQLVPNQIPHGQKQLVYPKTATSAPLNIALGFVALIMLLIQRASGRSKARAISE